MTKVFERVGFVGRYNDDTVAETLSTLSTWLGERNIRTVLDESTAVTMPDLGLEVVSRESLGTECDLVIVVGGDGTLLNAARSLAGQAVPLLGINRGRLGFLVDVSPSEMLDRLDEILSGDYISEERSLLQTRLLRNGQCVTESCALNDVVVHKLDIARMVELEVTIEGRFLDNIRADGLIVATPTGSTAYALSGGGPILHPSLDANVLVPICPHTLSNRPIVVNEDSRIDIVVHNMENSEAQVTHDGQVKTLLEAGDRIGIHTMDRKLQLIHPAGYDYFHILRAKLHWGGHAAG